MIFIFWAFAAMNHRLSLTCSHAAPQAHPQTPGSWVGVGGLPGDPFQGPSHSPGTGGKESLLYIRCWQLGVEGSGGCLSKLQLSPTGNQRSKNFYRQKWWRGEGLHLSSFPPKSASQAVSVLFLLQSTELV